MSPLLVRFLSVLVVLAVVTLAGWWWQRRDRRVRHVDGDTARVSADHLTGVGLDLDGAAAGAILLGSPTCAPCVEVERVLADLAASRSGFRWVKIDAADHLDLAAAHRVLRVPTLLVVDGDRRLLARTSGVPTVGDLAAVIDTTAEPDRADPTAA